jgi:hypothetical protein
MDEVNDIAKAAGCDVVGQVALHENPRSQLGRNHKYDATKLVDNSLCGVQISSDCLSRSRILGKLLVSLLG